MSTMQVDQLLCMIYVQFYCNSSFLLPRVFNELLIINSNEIAMPNFYAKS